MKKLVLVLGLAAFLMTSCCNKQENKGNCEGKGNCKDKKEQCDKKHECDHQKRCNEMAEFDVLLNAFANWNNLDDEQKADAINMAKTCAEKRDAMRAEMGKCGDKPKPDCCKEKKDCKKDGKECCKENKDCKKDGKECCKENKDCKKDGKECCKDGAKKCDGNHEGCKHSDK